MSIKNRALDRLSKLFDNNGRKTPLPDILVANAGNRSGISKLRVKNRVLQRESEIFQFDTPHTKMLEVIVEEVMNELIENSFIEVVTPPTSVIVQGEGFTASGEPVVVLGRNVNFANGKGVIR